MWMECLEKTKKGAEKMSKLEDSGYYKEGKPICPLCKCICKDEQDRHRHLEESHNDVAGPDAALMEKTENKELLTEGCGLGL